MELNKIIQGDSLEVMRGFPDKSIDLILTDIPYGKVNRDSNGLRELDKGDADIFTMDLDILCKELIRLSKGSIYVFCGTEQVSGIRKKFVENDLSTRLIIWQKTNPSPMNGEYIWLSGIECCVYGKNKGATFNGHCRNTVLKYPNGSSKVHPTEKPIDLFKDLILTSSNPGDIILDPFLGSGTTAIAAKQLNRNYIGIEISPEYCKIAEERLKSVTPSML